VKGWLVFAVGAILLLPVYFGAGAIIKPEPQRGTDEQIMVTFLGRMAVGNVTEAKSILSDNAIVMNGSENSDFSKFSDEFRSAGCKASKGMSFHKGPSKIEENVEVNFSSVTCLDNFPMFLESKISGGLISSLSFYYMTLGSGV
jgi:hypothetical protein